MFIFFGYAGKTSGFDPKIKITPLTMENKSSHSNINISISVAKQEIIDSLNIVIDETLATEFDLGYKDLEIKTWKTEDASFRLEGKDLFLVLNLKIWARKNIIFADAVATGELRLIFKTSFDVSRKWKIKSKTKIHEYEWVKKPVIEIGIIRFPVETIANIIIDRTKEEIGNQIDFALSENLIIDKDVIELYNLITKARLIDEVNNLWLVVKPIEINVKKIFEDKDSLRTTINFISDFSIVAGHKPSTALKAELPPFKWVDRIGDKTEIKIRASISMDQLNSMVSDSFVGRKFKSGKRTVIVDSFEIIPEGENLKIEAYISGSIKGKATIKGRPKFDSKTQELKVSNLGLSLKTKNIFKKIGFWFIKGKVKKQIKRYIRYSMRDQMELIRKSISNEIYAYNKIEGIKVSTGSYDINIDDLYFDEKEITGSLTARGIIRVSILDIRALSKFDIGSLE